MGERKPSKVNIPMCIACVLLCLTLFSIHLTAGLYARYTASSESTDTARVAKFDVKVLGEILRSAATPAGEEEPLEWVVNSDGNGEYQITVTSASEVAVRYDIFVELEEALPEYLTLKLGEDSFTEEGTDKKLWKLGNAGTFPAGGGEQKHTLTFAVDWAKFTESAAQKETADGATQVYRSETLPFTVKIRAEQID